MPKLTLLEMTQDILSDMDGDEVNSINDTVESLQVAQIIKSTYFNIIDGRDWPHLYKLFTLDPSGDNAKPNYMSLPSTVVKVEWIKYNKRDLDDTKDKFSEVTYKAPKDFIAITDLRDSSATNVETVVDASGVNIYVLNDAAPTYFTSFDDENIVFDSYDSDVDTTLQESKTQCWGQESVSFSLTDAFIPDLPVQTFSYLLNEAKATCFAVLKQMVNGKAEQHSLSQKRRMSQDAWRIQRGITYPDYGRK